MKNFLKSKFRTILILIATVALAGIAIFTAFRLYKLRQEAVAPTAPTSKPAAVTCIEQCPGSDGVLRNCHPPASDGTSHDSICNSDLIGTIKPCGGTSYCCNGTKWTTVMNQCQADDPSCGTLSFAINLTPTPTASSTSTPTAIPTPTATGTAIPTPTATGTAIPTPTATGTAIPTPTATGTTDPAQATLPEAGISLPTIFGLGIGGSLLLISLLLAL